MKRRAFLQAVGLTAAASVVAKPATAQTPKIVVEETTVPASDPGIAIFVRNKRPQR